MLLWFCKSYPHLSHILNYDNISFLEFFCLPCINWLILSGDIFIKLPLNSLPKMWISLQQIQICQVISAFPLVFLGEIIHEAFYLTFIQMGCSLVPQHIWLFFYHLHPRNLLGLWSMLEPLFPGLHLCFGENYLLTFYERMYERQMFWDFTFRNIFILP